MSGWLSTLDRARAWLRNRWAHPAETERVHDLEDLLARHARIERTLWETTLLQEAILDSANYIVISTDRRGIIRTFNRAAVSWLG